MGEEVKHSLLPWKHNRADGYRCGKTVMEQADLIECASHTVFAISLAGRVADVANADIEMMLRAVNSHADLVALAKRVAFEEDCRCAICDDVDVDAGPCLRCAAQSALAKAGVK